MSKRKIELVSNFNNLGASENKILHASSSNEEEKIIPIRLLPSEIIVNIIALTADYKTFLSCMCLSNEIRCLLLSTPDVMRKICIHYNKYEDSSAESYIHMTQFLGEIGRSIKSFMLTLCEDDEVRDVLKIILSEVPSLETFELVVRGSCTNERDWDSGCSHGLRYPVVDDIPALEKLKSLKINPGDVKVFVDSSKDVTNLEELILVPTEEDEDDNSKEFNEQIFLDFLCRQNNLKILDLNFGDDDFDMSNFPSQDISENVQFRLKTLKMNFVFNDTENYKKFLKTQADNLEELESYFNYENNLLNFAFTTFKNLKKWSMGVDQDSTMFSDRFNLKLDKVTTFEDECDNIITLEKIFERFPNLDTIKCSEIEMKEARGTFDKIVTLELETLNSLDLKGIKLPNLKNLKITQFLEVCDLRAWMRFSKKIENLESLSINVDSNKDAMVKFTISNLKIVLKSLKSFKKLINFEFSNSAKTSNPKEFKFVIEIPKKVINIGSNFPEDIKEQLKKLLSNYSLNVFAVDVPKQTQPLSRTLECMFF